MDKITKDTLIPKELADVLLTRTYEFYKAGYPVEIAIKEGVKIFNDYWERKNADKSGS